MTESDDVALARLEATGTVLGDIAIKQVECACMSTNYGVNMSH